MMTRQWMYYWRSYSYSASRPDAAHYLPPELPGLIGKVKAADPECCWFFEPEAEGVGVWIESVPDVVQLAARAVAQEAAGREATIIWPRTRTICYPGLSGRDLRDELSAASSDLALSLLTARTQPHRAPAALAVAHLRLIAWLVPEAVRLPFLFQCWHQWGAALAPRARVECAEDARRWVGSITPEQALAGLGAAWSGYQRALLDLIRQARARADAPVNYLLFDHAHRTHARLGIGPAAEALAARVVRAEHAEGATPAPWPASSRPLADFAALAAVTAVTAQAELDRV